MKKLLFVVLGVVISSTVLAQDLNPLFEKNRFSLNFFPEVGFGSSHMLALGLKTGIGYNLFNKTEIGIDLTYINFHSDYFNTNYFKTNLYAKYYFLKGRFSPFIEFDNNFSNMYEANKWQYKPSIGIGCGYYAINGRLAIEAGLFHTFFNTQSPYFIEPRINLKWYFK